MVGGGEISIFQTAERATWYVFHTQAMQLCREGREGRRRAQDNFPSAQQNAHNYSGPAGTSVSQSRAQSPRALNDRFAPLLAAQVVGSCKGGVDSQLELAGRPAAVAKRRHLKEGKDRDRSLPEDE